MRKRIQATKERKEFTPAQAKLVLDQLMRAGHVTRAALNDAEKAIDVERQGLLDRLRELGGLPVALMVAGAAGAAAATRPGIRRRARGVARKTKEIVANATKAEVTPERARTRQLQGKYLGLTHQISKDVVAEKFGKEAIASRGKETIIAEMEAYLRTGDSAGSAASSGHHSADEHRGG